MTMLSSRLNLIEDTIAQKESLIEQLRVEISQMQQHVHAVKGVSELCENLRALALQTWMSVYTVCPEEEALIMQELEQARLDAKSKVEAGIAQLPEMVEPQPEFRPESPTEPEPGQEVTVDVEVVEEKTSATLQEPTDNVKEGNNSNTVVVIEEETPDTLAESGANKNSDNSPDSTTATQLLSAADLDKDTMDFATLKKLAAAKGIKARRRAEIEKELIEAGTTKADLEEVLASLEF